MECDCYDIRRGESPQKIKLARSCLSLASFVGLNCAMLYYDIEALRLFSVFAAPPPPKDQNGFVATWHWMLTQNSQQYNMTSHASNPAICLA
jgi:hypothetical protein